MHRGRGRTRRDRREETGARDGTETQKVIFMEYLKDHWTDIVNAIMAVVIAARVIVKLTPTPKDDTFLEKVIEWLKHLGLHVDSTEKK